LALVDLLLEIDVALDHGFIDAHGVMKDVPALLTLFLAGIGCAGAGRASYAGPRRAGWLVETEHRGGLSTVGPSRPRKRAPVGGGTTTLRIPAQSAS
jgi:hypothetical protein